MKISHNHRMQKHETMYLMPLHILTLLKNRTCKLIHTMYQRIIKWPGLEEPLKIIYFQPSCCGQGHLLLDRIGPSNLD